ncbi:MAG TPA: sigma-70 family RNA polymerase sigma factor [Verrucomicrobiae bacterium]
MPPLACIDGTLNPADERTDLELVAAANGGDAAAFEGLYARHRDWVANLAYRFCGDRELALDVLQEAFLYLLKKFPHFELRCELRSFLYPVVKHLALNARAKAGRFETGESREELFAGLEAPRVEAGADEGLRGALAKLPVQQRETVVLRFMDGMDLAEIAAALEVPLGTVKSRLHHALEALRKNPALKEFFE